MVFFGSLGSIRSEFLDLALDLGADVDDLFRLDRAGGIDGGQQLSPLRRSRAELGLIARSREEIPPASRSQCPKHGQNHCQSDKSHNENLPDRSA
jgi:hypothetical protein